MQNKHSTTTTNYKQTTKRNLTKLQHKLDTAQKTHTDHKPHYKTMSKSSKTATQLEHITTQQGSTQLEKPQKKLKRPQNAVKHHKTNNTGFKQQRLTRKHDCLFLT